MRTLAERQKAAHDAFTSEQKSLVRRAVGLLIDSYKKLKKKEADLGVDPIDTRRKLRVLEGSETEPGIIALLAEPGEGVQTDAFHERAGSMAGEEDSAEPDEAAPAEPVEVWTPDVLGVSGEDLPKGIPYRGSLVSSEETFGEIRERAISGTLTEIDGVGPGGAGKIISWLAQTEGAMRAEIEGGDADEGAEGDEPLESKPHDETGLRTDDEVLDDTERQEADEGPVADAEASEPAEEGGEAVDEVPVGDTPNPWRAEWLEAAGEDLPAALPFRGSLVESGLALGEIRRRWLSGHLRTIEGIGPAGAKRLTEWFADAEAAHRRAEAAGDPRGAAMLALRKGEEVEVKGGGILQIVTSRSGSQLAFVRPGAKGPSVWPDAAPYLTEEEAHDMARAVLEGGAEVWEEVRETIVEAMRRANADGAEKAAEPAEPGSEPESEPASEAGPATREVPDVGDAVCVQPAEGAARRLYIGGITVMEPKLASLVESIEWNDTASEIVGRGPLVARVKIAYLTSTLTAGEWTVPVTKVGFVE